MKTIRLRGRKLTTKDQTFDWQQIEKELLEIAYKDEPNTFITK